MGKLNLTKEEVIDFSKKAAYNFCGEFIGTGILVFGGCMSTVMGFGQPGDSTGVSLSFSLAIMTGIEAVVHISGGHINPILTLTAIIFKKVSIAMAVVYVIAQFCGAIVGYGFIMALVPSSISNVKHYHGACTTYPNPDISVVQATFIEFVASSIFVLLVCAQWDPRNTHLEAVSIKIAFGIFALAYFAGPFTGCGMNPARSLAPAIYNDTWDHHWIYWVSPFSASIIWSLIYYKVFVELDPKKSQE